MCVCRSNSFCPLLSTKHKRHPLATLLCTLFTISGRVHVIYLMLNIRMDVAKAAELVAYVFGYHVQASSKSCAAMTVFCKSQWTGTILITLKHGAARIVANIAKCPQVLSVTDEQATVNSFIELLTFIARTADKNFYNLKAGQSPMAAPTWHANERLLVHSAVVLSHDAASPHPFLLRIKDGEWRIKFYCSPIMTLRLQRDYVCLHVANDVKIFKLPSYTTLHLHRDNFFAGNNCSSTLLKWLVGEFIKMQQC